MVLLLSLVARHDVALAHDAAVVELEDAVGDDLTAAGELAGDRRRGALPVGDRVVHRRLHAGRSAVLQHPAEHVLAVARPGRARGVVAIDLNELDVVGVQAEQGLDVPLLVATPESVDVECGPRVGGHSSSFGACRVTRTRTTIGVEPGFKSSPDFTSWTTRPNYRSGKWLAEPASRRPRSVTTSASGCSRIRIGSSASAATARTWSVSSRSSASP